MKIKDFKAILDKCDDDAEILVEEKITGEEYGFDYMMGCYIKSEKNTIVLYSL